MDRRKFLTGLLGVAGAAAAVSVLKPAEAMAAMPSAGRGGILDELEADVSSAAEAGDDLTPQTVQYYGGGYGYRRRPRPRYVWRRVCRRVRGYYGWTRRCWRERVRVW